MVIFGRKWVLQGNKDGLKYDQKVLPSVIHSRELRSMWEKVLIMTCASLSGVRVVT